MKKPTTEETKAVVFALLMHLSAEELAVALDRSYPSVCEWKKGNRPCSLGDYKLMQSMLAKHQKKGEK